MRQIAENTAEMPLMAKIAERVRSAEALVYCSDLSSALEFLTVQAGFRLDAIFPADSPETAVISGYGASIRLTEDKGIIKPGRIRLAYEGLLPGDNIPAEIDVPGGLIIELVNTLSNIDLPEGEQKFVVSRSPQNADWNRGRAGMEYRDLSPGRYGGRFIASHIRIPGGGPVPDYVHYHKVRFQMIFCKSGWARVAYEDQGDPIEMRAGDCVLQPPEIRHRVLETSPGFEVVEVGSPAMHETFADHNMELPTGRNLPEKLFCGQRFVHHKAQSAEWMPIPGTELAFRDTGIGEATKFLAGVRVLRCQGKRDSALAEWATAALPRDEFLFYFILSGGLSLKIAGDKILELGEGDCFTLPAGMECVSQSEKGFEVLEVRLPAARH